METLFQCFIDDDGFYFYVPDRLICCNLEKHRKMKDEIEKMKTESNEDEN